MNIVIHDARAFKQTDGKWFIKYTILHDREIDDIQRACIFHTVHRKIGDYFKIEFEIDLTSYPYTPLYYVPKDDAEEVEFMLRFPLINDMSFEI